MKELTKNKNLEKLMWDRLSVEPEALNLDYRTDEEPEDLFVRLSNKGQRKEVLRTLKALLAKIVFDDTFGRSKSAVRFISRAMRLCDSLAAKECKPVLMSILILEESNRWGKHLPEFRELAARALLSLPKTDSDSALWESVARKLNSALPYALNAAIEINLYRGLMLLCDTYLACSQNQTTDIADWRAILQIAALVHGKEALGQVLREACLLYPECPTLYGDFADLSEIPELRQRRERSVQDLLTYTPSVKTRKEPNVAETRNERLNRILAPASSEVSNLQSGGSTFPDKMWQYVEDVEQGNAGSLIPYFSPDRLLYANR